jgi:hypothetical protein
MQICLHAFALCIHPVLGRKDKTEAWKQDALTQMTHIAVMMVKESFSNNFTLATLCAETYIQILTWTQWRLHLLHLASNPLNMAKFAF